MKEDSGNAQSPNNSFDPPKRRIIRRIVLRNTDFQQSLDTTEARAHV
jgi:hypothetical protein